MVNAGTVNARAASVFYRIFARFLQYFVRFLLFKNSVKYNRIFCVNRCRSPAPVSRVVTGAHLLCDSNELCA